MRALAFFALVALTASAFNITEYHLGIASGLGFNATETQSGQTCLNALAFDFQAIADLIESRDFTNITLGLGNLVLQVKNDIETTCMPYYVDYYVYLAQNTNVTNITEIIKASIEQNYPELISVIGSWVQYISEGQDFDAGYEQAEFFQILVGAVQFYNSAPTQVTPVPFNRTEFFTEYNAALFQMLGIDAQANVTGLVECSYYVQNATLTFLYMKEQLSTLDFEQKLNGLQYLIGLTLDSVRNCGAAYETFELVFGPVEKAFAEDPVNFTIQVLENTAINFPAIKSALDGEIVAIETGEYAIAGEDKAAMIFDSIENLVPFDN